MSTAAIGALQLPAAAGGRTSDTPAKIKEAASQFESMLIGQMLRSARESTSDDGDSGSAASNSTYMEVAEQQFAGALAANGGMGIAKMVVAQLGDKHADQQ
jgi:flagellar protein FlgJ